MNRFPVIDPVATGQNILRIRKARGLSVRDLQQYFGFEEPQAIYQWQWGRTLPSVDNLYALSCILNVSMEDIIVPVPNKTEQQERSCCSSFYSIFTSAGRAGMPALLYRLTRYQPVRASATRTGFTPSGRPDRMTLSFCATALAWERSSSPSSVNT